MAAEFPQAIEISAHLSSPKFRPLRAADADLTEPAVRPHRHTTDTDLPVRIHGVHLTFYPWPGRAALAEISSAAAGPSRRCHGAVSCRRLYGGRCRPRHHSGALRRLELVADRQGPDPLAGGVVERVHQRRRVRRHSGLSHTARAQMHEVLHEGSSEGFFVRLR